MKQFLSNIRDFFFLIKDWFYNAWLRTEMLYLKHKKLKQIEKAYEFEAKTEGAFSYIPIIDQHIEQMLVKRLKEMGCDPTDARTFVDKLKVRQRPSSLAWELDGKEIMRLGWVDTGNGEVIYRLKEVSASRLTLITSPKDIVQPTNKEIKIVNG